MLNFIPYILYCRGSFNVIPFNVILLSTNKGYVIILKATIGLQMIVTEASKITQDVSTSGKHAGPSTDEENIARMPGATEGSVVLRSPSKSLKVMLYLLPCILTKSHL